MGHSVEQWSNSIMQLMPRGVIWQRETTLDLYKYAAGYAPRLDAAEVSAEAYCLKCAQKPRCKCCQSGKVI